MASLPVLGAGRITSALLVVVEHGPLTAAQLAERLGVTAKSARGYMRRFAEMGLVTRHGEGWQIVEDWQDRRVRHAEDRGQTYTRDVRRKRHQEESDRYANRGLLQQLAGWDQEPSDNDTSPDNDDGQ